MFSSHELKPNMLMNLVQATGYQRKYTKRKILFLLFLLVIGMIILLIVKPKRSHAAPATSPPDDPISRLGETKPQPEVEAARPDVVQPNDVRRFRHSVMPGLPSDFTP